MEEEAFYVEMYQVITQLLNEPGTFNFGKYFVNIYLTRVKKLAYFNRKHLAIDALMTLVREKSFERMIKISKQKRSSKLVQIISSHNKSTNIL